MSRKSLADLNAAVMQAVPRSGGYVTILNQTKSAAQDNQEKKECACGVDAQARLPSFGGSPGKSEINFLSAVFSTVMLLASGLGATELQIEVTRAYLNCIRDDEGNTPPNIQGLLNEIELQYGPPATGCADIPPSNKSSKSRVSSGVSTPKQ